MNRETQIVQRWLWTQKARYESLTSAYEGLDETADCIRGIVGNEFKNPDYGTFLFDALEHFLVSVDFMALARAIAFDAYEKEQAYLLWREDLRSKLL